MSDDAIQLRDQVGVLRRRWRVVAATLVLAIGLGLLISFLATPMYEAETEVLLPPASGTDSPTAEDVATQARTVVLFAGEVIDTLSLDESTQDLLDTVTVEPDPEGAAVLVITASRDDAEESADVANTMAQAYIDSTDVDTANRVDTLDKRINTLDQKIARLNNKIDLTAEDDRLVTLRSDRRKLLAERTLLIDARAAALREAGVEGDQAQVVTPAVTPAAATSPQPVRIVALAGALGLLIGIGLAYLRDYFDDSVRDDGQVVDRMGGRPVLGHIPQWGRSQASGPITSSSPRAPASEAYRELGANVRFLLGVRRQGDAARRDPGRTVLVTSAAASEGKTATAVNLAVVAAAANLRVVLVDANLRRPHVQELFDVPTGRGLADVLRSSCTVHEALVDVGHDQLLVLPAGDVQDSPADLLTSPQLPRLLTELRSEADLVVVDSAAVLRVADALELARVCDLVVLVARSKMSRGSDLTETLQRIDRVGGSTAGVVLNAVEDGHGRSRGYGSR